MPRYYVDIHEHSMFLRDEEGSEFDSLDAAMRGAARSAAEISQERLAKCHIGDVVIEVRDERNQRVCTVKASMEIDWHNTRPMNC